MITTLVGLQNSLKKTLIPTPKIIIVQQNLTKLVFVMFLILKGTFDFKFFWYKRTLLCNSKNEFMDLYNFHFSNQNIQISVMF
jgi:hypothetical protein